MKAVTRNLRAMVFPPVCVAGRAAGYAAGDDGSGCIFRALSLRLQPAMMTEEQRR